MYLFYLRYKAFLVIHRNTFHKIGKVIVGIVCLSLINLIVADTMVGYSKYHFASTLLFAALSFGAIFLITIFHDNISDMDKKILCQNLSTGYKECDDLINEIVECARKRKHFKFKYGHTFRVAMDNLIDEPYILDKSSTHINRAIYPCTSHEGVVFLREILYSMIEKRDDYYKLERILVEIV